MSCGGPLEELQFPIKDGFIVWPICLEDQLDISFGVGFRVHGTEVIHESYGKVVQYVTDISYISI